VSPFAERSQDRESKRQWVSSMTPEEYQELDQCVQRIAQILYQDAQAQDLPMSRLIDIEFQGLNGERSMFPKF
jgi:hypothetical protein